MSEPMTVRVEVWPVAADEAGIWLLDTDAWRPNLPVMADTEPHADVELELASHGALAQVRLLHSTSWRMDGPAMMVTYVAVVGLGGLVRERWPAARPVSGELADAVGKPAAHGPTDPPTPRYIDVLMHGLRHLAFLLGTDTTCGDALDEHWRRHLAGLQPALAGLYQETPESA